jgi:EpsI family protein
LLFGREVFACVRFPLGYLLLGIPIWDHAINRLQPLSQILSAQIAGGLLQTIGIPVLRDGTKLVLPTVVLEVMGECSGVNQLLAVVAMALPAGYLLLKGAGRRISLIVLAVVTAYVSNGARIALVGFLAHRGLSNGYLALFGCLSLLAKSERTKHDRAASTSPPPRSMASRIRHPRLEIATSIVMLSMGAFQVLLQPTDIRLRNDLRAFPRRIDDWTLDAAPQPSTVRFPAIDDEFIHAYPGPTGERHFDAVDDELVRAYRNSRGELVRLYVGYHRSQREGKELAGEISSALGAVAMPIKVDSGSGTVELSQVLKDTSRSRRGLLYWYDLNGRVTSNMYVAKGLMVWDAVTRHRTNAAVIMIAWESRELADAEIEQRRAVAFARAILPLLPHFIPS